MDEKKLTELFAAAMAAQQAEFRAGLSEYFDRLDSRLALTYGDALGVGSRLTPPRITRVDLTNALSGYEVSIVAPVLEMYLVADSVPNGVVAAGAASGHDEPRIAYQFTNSSGQQNRNEFYNFQTAPRRWNFGRPELTPAKLVITTAAALAGYSLIIVNGDHLPPGDRLHGTAGPLTQLNLSRTDAINLADPALVALAGDLGLSRIEGATSEPSGSGKTDGLAVAGGNSFAAVKRNVVVTGAIAIASGSNPTYYTPIIPGLARAVTLYARGNGASPTGGDVQAFQRLANISGGVPAYEALAAPVSIIGAPTTAGTWTRLAQYTNAGGGYGFRLNLTGHVNAGNTTGILLVAAYD